jgi:hypothetical protein
MEQQYQHDPGKSLFELNLDATNSYTLRSAASWAKVTGVVGALIGFLFLIGAIATLAQPPQSAYRGRQEGFNDVFNSDATGLGATIMIITGLVFIFTAIFSFYFGRRIGLALKANDQESLTRGFASIRNYFAFRGIVLIIVLLLFLLSLAASL